MGTASTSTATEPPPVGAPASARSHSVSRLHAAMTPPSAERYAREFLAGWGTMDFNGHLANTAYLDLAADVRMAFFAEHGFPPAEFRRLGLGPVVRKD